MRQPTTHRTTLRVVLLFAVVALQVLPEHLTSRLNEAVGWTRTGDWTVPVPRHTRELHEGREIDPANQQAQWHAGLVILLLAGNLGSAPFLNGSPTDQPVKDANRVPALPGGAAARHFDIYKNLFQLHDGTVPSNRNDGTVDGGPRVGDLPAS